MRAMSVIDEIRDEVYALRENGYEPDEVMVGVERYDKLYEEMDTFPGPDAGEGVPQFEGIRVVGKRNMSGVAAIDGSAVVSEIIESFKPLEHDNNSEGQWTE